jgi:phage shock protein C
VNPRRLYRSRRDRQLAGVAGGIADYLEIDPTVVRILWILSVFLGGFGILLYIIMAFVVPLEPGMAPAPGTWQPAVSGPTGETSTDDGGVTPGGAATTPEWPAGAAWTGPADDRQPGRGSLYLGVILIAFGAIAMANLAIPGLAGSGFVWAGLAVALGVALIVGATRRKALDQ